MEFGTGGPPTGADLESTSLNGTTALVHIVSFRVRTFRARVTGLTGSPAFLALSTRYIFWANVVISKTSEEAGRE